MLIVMLATSMDLSVFARSDVEDTVYTSSSVSASQGMEETDSSQNSIAIPDTDVELSDEITRTYEGRNYRATFSVTSTWKSGVNVDVVIENTGSETIHDWYLSFDCYDEILNIWNATVYSHSGGNYIVKNAVWNEDINVGSSVHFGYTGKLPFKGLPEEAELKGSIGDIRNDKYTVNYRVDNDWGDGYTACIDVTNNTDKVIEDWLLEFDFDREITGIWKAVIESHYDNHYIIRNAGYETDIAPGATISFGFMGNGGSADDVPIGFRLRSYKVRKIIDVNLDTDKDGAEDYLEEYFGTDINSEDTDKDGLPDFVELYTFVLDPLKKDSDDNGVFDGDEDSDGDGLINIKEVEEGSSILETDSDYDGLNDYEEYAVYKTSLINSDTDGDELSDYKEVQYGTNPLVFDKLFNIDVKSDEADTVKASVEIELDGAAAESLQVRRFDNDFLFPINMPGYIGGAYDFSVEGSFDTATISFEFDSALLSDSSFDPVIYYFNENEQLLEELPTVVNGNVASATVTHFSKYILINRTVFAKSFEWEDVWSTSAYTGVDVILVIDDSGSMDDNDPNDERLEVAKTLIDKLPQGSSIGLVRFTDATNKLTKVLTYDKDEAKSYITSKKFKSDGGTHMYNAIEKAIPLFTTTDDSRMKMMVVITDGKTTDTKKHDKIVKKASEQSIKIYTVGLGAETTYFEQYLKPLANNTAGKFYLASQASELGAIYDDINKSIDVLMDSDGDGLSDYYEENMVMFNGVKLQLDKDNPDTDNDELDDGEEVIEVKCETDAEGHLVIRKKLISNPLMEDTDEDGLSDCDEIKVSSTNPLIADTDFDGLIDGFEENEGFDPLSIDGDNDSLLDSIEYLLGTDPRVADPNWLDYRWDFVKGFVAGDFIKEPDSIATVAGQILSSIIPWVDVRDIVGCLRNQDYLFAGINAIALIPAIGDVADAAGTITKYIVKNIDNVDGVAKTVRLFRIANNISPDIVNHLAKSDEIASVFIAVNKADNGCMTRASKEIVMEVAEKAGKSSKLIKSSNAIKGLKDSVAIGKGTWLEGWCKRGKIIDEILNGHKSGKGILKGTPAW